MIALRLETKQPNDEPRSPCILCKTIDLLFQRRQDLDRDRWYNLFLPYSLARNILVSGNTASEAACEWAKHNQRCHTGDDLFLPTRLIYVAGNNDEVGLIPNSQVPHHSHYVLDQMENIPWSTFPKSFQEAISFTRKLDVEDPEDYTRYGTEEHQLYAQQSFPEVTNLYLNHLAELLFKRAWTFQERLVSPRILYSTKYELIWKCHYASACECGFHGDGPYNPTNLKKQHIDALADYLSPLRRSPTNYSGYIKSIIPSNKKMKSPKGLTNQTDRLLAVGASAKQTQAARWSKTYLAKIYPVIHDSTPSLKPHAKVLDASCEYADGNQFGQATKGRLTLRGKSIACRLCKVSGEDTDAYRILHPELKFELEISVDCEPLQQTDGQIPVLLLRIADTCEFPAPVSIILREEKTAVDGEVLYTRVELASPPRTTTEGQEECRKLMAWFDRHSELQTSVVI
ncbi:HET-domain-containing protein [Daldinia sp. FL1419]|nr:HET-domain-containing protein [Daldinia sp. FL1419]